WMYRRKDRQKALKRAEKEQSPVKFRSAGATLISRQTLMTVELTVPSCKVEPASQEVIWDGRITNAAFKVSTPDASSVGKTIGTCNFCVNGLRIGQVLFEISPTTVGAQQHISQSSALKSAFASYASQDRQKVLARVQGIEKLGVRVFMDVRDLKAG